MRRIIRLTITAGLIVSALSMTSCKNKDNYDYSLTVPNATVTVKPVDKNTSFYLQLDDNTTLEPANMSKSPFGEKETRAFANYKELDEQSSDYTKKVSINWMKEILTKNLVKDLGGENDSKYGKNPVEIIDSWVSIVEDGYITLQFVAPWGNYGIAHEINLIYAGTDKDPYVVEFRHNAHGDYGSDMKTGFVAFRLDGQDSEIRLPDTKGQTVDLTFKYESFSGPKSVKFKYCTRKTTETGKPETGSIDRQLELR